MSVCTVLRDKENTFKGFSIVGHAHPLHYDPPIVCAGISALVQTTVNSVTSLTDDDVTVNVVKKEPIGIELIFNRPPSPKAALLVESMLLGLESIKESYGDGAIRFINVTI